MIKELLIEQQHLMHVHDLNETRSSRLAALLQDTLFRERRSIGAAPTMHSRNENLVIAAYCFNEMSSCHRLRFRQVAACERDASHRRRSIIRLFRESMIWAHLLGRI